MKRYGVLLIVILLAIVLASRLNVVSASYEAVTYDLSWYTIDGGGATFSTGGSYSLGGTIGQFDAGSMNGGSYTINSGFWGGASINYNIYLPLVLKNA